MGGKRPLPPGVSGPTQQPWRWGGAWESHLGCRVAACPLALGCFPISQTKVLALWLQGTSTSRILAWESHRLGIPGPGTAFSQGVQPLSSLRWTEELMSPGQSHRTGQGTPLWEPSSLALMWCGRPRGRPGTAGAREGPQRKVRPLQGQNTQSSPASSHWGVHLTAGDMGTGTMVVHQDHSHRD